MALWYLTVIFDTEVSIVHCIFHIYFSLVDILIISVPLESLARIRTYESGPFQFMVGQGQR